MSDGVNHDIARPRADVHPVSMALSISLFATSYNSLLLLALRSMSFTNHRFQGDLSLMDTELWLLESLSQEDVKEHRRQRTFWRTPTLV